MQRRTEKNIRKSTGKTPEKTPEKAPEKAPALKTGHYVSNNHSVKLAD
jgi:hypothetical protein